MTQLSALVKRYKKDAVSMMRLSCIAMSFKVITRTPVDKGSARASWTANNGGPVTRNVDISSANPNATRNDITQVANSLKPGDKYTLANGQPYIRALEYDSHSAQAPQGMLRRSTAEWDKIVQEATRGI